MGLLLIFTSARLLANNSGSRADFDGDGNLTQQVDPDGNTSNYRYDAQGDQTQLILGAGSSNPGTTSDSYDGDGNLTLSVNPVGDSTSYQFDADGNQTLEIDGYNTSSAATIHYLYDTDGNQTQEIDPDGNTTSYEYDTDGDQTLMIQAYGTTAAATTAYQYDNDNNLTLQTNPNGTSLSMSYDADGNLTGELWYASNGTETNSLNYTYDGDGNNLTASNDAGSYSFAYNADGEETQAVTPSGVTLNYQYDTAGDVTQITDSLGDTVTSQYDADGDLTQRDATGPNGAQADVTLGYDGDGNLTSITRQSQGQTVGSSAYTYDAQGDVTSIIHENASGGTLDSFSYSYDAAAQLTQEVDYGTGTTDYTYDATGQLIAAGPTNYSYDANGNPNSSNDTIGPNNELLSDGTWNYSYDGNGNMIGKVGVTGGVDAGLSWSYSYDSDNELIGAKETNSQNQTLVSATYTYDVFGLRIESSVSTNGGTPVVTQFVYNGDTLWATLTSSGSLQTLYVSDDQPDQFFAQIDASAGVGWYLTDHLGSVRDVMNNSSQVTDAITYDAYGNVVSQSDPSQAPLIGWDGYQTFAALGVDEAGQRIYDPEMERWMQQDPILLNAGPNSYEYVNDEPTNATDPTGEEANPVRDQARPQPGSIEDLYAKKDQVTRDIVRLKIVAQSWPGVAPDNEAAIAKLEKTRRQYGDFLSNLLVPRVQAQPQPRSLGNWDGGGGPRGWRPPASSAPMSGMGLGMRMGLLPRTLPSYSSEEQYTKEMWQYAAKVLPIWQKRQQQFAQEMLTKTPAELARLLNQPAPVQQLLDAVIQEVGRSPLAQNQDEARQDVLIAVSAQSYRNGWEKAKKEAALAQQLARDAADIEAKSGRITPAYDMFQMAAERRARMRAAGVSEWYIWGEMILLPGGAFDQAMGVLGPLAAAYETRANIRSTVNSARPPGPVAAETRTVAGGGVVGTKGGQSGFGRPSPGPLPTAGELLISWMFQSGASPEQARKVAEAMAQLISSQKAKLPDAAAVDAQMNANVNAQGGQNAPKGRIPGASDAEHAVDELLRSQGRSVEPNVLEGVAGAGRQGDRLVDGVLTEIKSVSGVAKQTPDALSGAIANRIMNGRGQAAHIIVDVRQQAGMTQEIAERGIRRAFGADNKTGGKIQSIRVIGNGFDITVPRAP